MRVKVYLKSGAVISYLLSPDKKQKVEELKHEIREVLSTDMEVKDSFVKFLDEDILDAYEVAAITIADASAE